MSKKITVFFLLLLFLLVGSFFISDEKISADESNLTGYAWSPYYGWISFYYGTSIDATGLLTGYAWADSVGWISFNPADLTGCPSGSCNARLDSSTDRLVGWARYISDANGWIQLGPIVIGGTDYGVKNNNGEMINYAWSDNLGWISFNCSNNSECGVSNYKVQYTLPEIPGEPIEIIEDTNFNGYAWSPYYGWISFYYGTSIDATGLLTGYAWADSVGWISFNPADLTGCPSGSCNARLDSSTDRLVGWARYISDANGWIQLGPIVIGGTDYGVKNNNGEMINYAWSDNLGWISFNCSNNSECGVSNYKVQYSSPVILSNPQTSINYCSHGSFPLVNDGLSVILSWSYFSESPQYSYTIEISPNSNFDSNVFSITVYSASTSYVVNLEGSSWNDEKLDWSTLYYWRVKAENNEGRQSNWISSTIDLRSRTHGSPLVIYSHEPNRILAGRSVNFEAQKDGVVSQTYNASSPIYSWTFTEATPETSSDFNPVVVFNTYGSTPTIKLRVTDSAGYYCEKTEMLDVGGFNPIWKDVSPF